MVEISPFKGITYNKKKISHLDKVMSPPYDIISKTMQEQLYDNDPYNFVRLILGKISPDDAASNNRYTRAKKEFDTWIDQSILIKSEKEALYPYRIEYTIDGQKRTMNGFFTLLQLDSEYKQVKAHEKTLSKPKADRLDLMRTCQANLEPIQLLYIDEKDLLQKEIQEKCTDEPLIHVKGYDSFDHSLWKINDENLINLVKNTLKDQIVFIADGHHRYQTAVNFAEEMKKKTGITSKDAPFNYIMIIFVNMFDKGLSILPTHRLLKIPIDKNDLLSKLNDYFVIETYLRGKEDMSHLVNTIKDKLQTTTLHRFCLFFKDAFYILTLKDESFMDHLAKEYSQTWRTLDVSILHKIIIENILGITQETLEDHITYTRDDEEAVRFVDMDEYDCSVLMNATKIDELKAIAEAEEHMPQKSTYFLPKMLSGLVLYKMDI
jgi:uncharacterized protein (DUF1015 family)